MAPAGAEKRRKGGPVAALPPACYATGARYSRRTPDISASVPPVMLGVEELNLCLAQGRFNIGFPMFCVAAAAPVA
jgi:hypothetical protein